MTMKVTDQKSGVVVNFPDGTPPETIDEVMRAATSAKAAPQGSTAGGMAKSFGAGALRGVAGVVGLPGDISNLVAQGTNWLGRKAGMDLQPLRPEENHMGGADMTRALEENVTGPLYEPQGRTEKYARTVGEFLPGMVGPGGLIRKGLEHTLLPGLGSEAAGQMTEGTAYEPYARVAGAMAGGLSGRAVTPAAPNAERRAAVDTLRQEGVVPTAGQATGSKRIGYLESETGGARVANMMEQQGEQFTAAALRRAGENARRATPDVIDGAFNRIGGQFDAVASRNTMQPDNRFLNDLGQAEADYRALVPDSQRVPAVDNVINDLLTEAGRGPIGGRSYQSYRSRLDRMARRTIDPELKDTFYDIRNALDDAMERSISPQDAAAWQEARRQYRNILVIERALGGGAPEAGTGIITPARLRMAAVGKDRRGYIRGRSDFTELANAGQSVMTPLPQSGTAPRLAARGVPAALAGGAGYLLSGGLDSASMAAMGGAMAPNALGWLAGTRPGQAYLQNRLMPRAPGMAPSTVGGILALPRALQGPTLPPDQRR